MADIKSTLLYRWFTEVWNNEKAEMIDELMLPGTTAHGNLADEAPSGSEGFKVFYNGFKSRFKDAAWILSTLYRRVIMNHIKAVHIPSGKPVDFYGICMVRKSEGRIAEAWNNFDFLTMYRQLGQKLGPVS